MYYNPSEPQWWITGFDPSYKNVKADDLTATFTVDFSGNKDMFDSFYKYWGDANSPWTFDPKKYTATYSF